MPQTKEAVATRSTQGDYLARVFNTLFNPFEYQRILTPPNPSPGSAALHHGAGLALGYGGLFFVLRKLSRYQQEQMKKMERDKLQAFVQARFPTLSVDPDVGDIEEEKALEELGLPEDKQANVSEFWQVTHPAQRAIIRTIKGPQDPAHLAVAAVAAIAGGMGGWQLAEYIQDRNRKNQLSERISTSKNTIDQMLHEEFKRTRGISEEKEAAKTGPTASLDPNYLRERFPGVASFPSGDPVNAPPSVLWTAATHPIKTLENLWWLWATAAFALSYRAGKSYADKKDPARMRMEQLKQVARDRARVRNAPILMDESSLEGLEKDVPKKRTKPPKPVTATKVEAAPKPQPKAKPAPTAKPEIAEKSVEPEIPVDASDPYADLLRV